MASRHPRVIHLTLFWDAVSLLRELASLLHAGWKKAGLPVWHSTKSSNWRLMPFRSTAFTTSICCPRRIRSQLSRPLRRDVCRIPLAFTNTGGLSIRMSAFSFRLKDFAGQKHYAVWNGFINVDQIHNIQYRDNLSNLTARRNYSAKTSSRI